MYLGEQRNVFYVFVAILFFFLWYSTIKRRANNELELEVQLLQKYSSPSDFNSCSTDSCLKLDRCLFDMDRIRVYVQPMVKIKYQNGKEMNLQKSNEFEQIRQAILQSEYAVDVPEKACLVVPGIDLLNLRKFKSASEIQRAIESVSTLLPPNSNLLLFNFIGLRDPLHLKAIWASASLDQYTLRRKFDVSVPMIRPYSLRTLENHTNDDHPILSKQTWTSIMRFASNSVLTQLKEALVGVDSNVTLIYLSETSETEKDVTVVKDQNGQQRDYVDVLKHSTFTLIHDLVPGFQMLILDAMQCGSIPVIIGDDYLPPFHELLNWSQFSILLAKQILPELPRILHSIQPDMIMAMRRRVQRIYWRHLSSPHQMTLSTLSLIERRILPVETNHFNNEWTDNEASSRLWLNVPIRSTASNFTIILAPPQRLDQFSGIISHLIKTTRSLLYSILVLWPVAERPSELHNFNKQLQSEWNIPIHYLNWDPAVLSSKMGSFVESIIYRSDSSRDCWLFMDLRSLNKEANFTQDLMEQAFAAWKENADSILSFDPYNENAGTQNEPVGGVLIENRKQSPFYHGAAFINPHAAEDIGKSSSSSEQWARCSKVASHRTDCEAKTKCPEFTMEFCRPTFL